jgi:hypothetical protein
MVVKNHLHSSSDVQASRVRHRYNDLYEGEDKYVGE